MMFVTYYCNIHTVTYINNSVFTEKIGYVHCPSSIPKRKKFYPILLGSGVFGSNATVSVLRWTQKESFP